MGTHPIFESDFDCLTEKMPYYENSDSDLDELVNGFSGLSVTEKKSIIDCGSCFSCEHVKLCPDTYCEDCSKIVNEIGCQNKWCNKHHSRENALKCSCTTNRLLKKYENGKKSVFGHFRCKVCQKKWTSAFAWVELGELLTQECKKCNVAVKPFKVKSKEWRGSNREEKATDPHDEQRCQMCKQLGRPCNKSNSYMGGIPSLYGY